MTGRQTHLAGASEQERRQRYRRQRRWSLLDRFTLLVMMVLLTVWSVCLWVLGGEPLGCCWAGLAEMAAAELAAVATGLALPGYVVRLVFLLASRLHPGEALAMQMALAGQSARQQAGPSGGRWLLNLLAASGLGGVLGGLTTTAGVYLAGWAMSGLATGFVLPGWSWAVVRWALEVLVMLPLGWAASAVVLTGSLLRRFNASDPYRHLTRDALWALTAGLAIAWPVWRAGMNLLGVALACPVLLAGLALATFARREGGVQTAPLAPSRPVVGRQVRQRWMNLGLWAMPAFLLLLQCRLLRDFGADWGGTWLWGALAGGMLALGADRLGRRVQPGRKSESAAAVAGAALLGTLQIALLALAALAGRGGWVWVLLAAAGQWPLSVLWATALDRRRRRFALSGYAGRLWLADAALGCSAGILLALAALSVRGGIVTGTIAAMVLPPAALAAANSFWAEGRIPPRPGLGHGLWRWATLGASSVLVVVLTGLGLARAGQRRLGNSIAVGASWTGFCSPGAALGVMPRRQPERENSELTLLVGRVIRLQRGKWWLVGADPRRSPLEYDDIATCELVFLDAAFADLFDHRAGRAGRAAGFPRQVITQTRQFDGIYLTGLPADHPDAWCLYNRQVLGRCLQSLSPSGLLVVQTGAGKEGVGEVMALANAFRSVCGGAAALAADADGIELVLLGRRENIEEPTAAVLLEGQAAGLNLLVLPVDDLILPGAAGQGWSIPTGRVRPSPAVTLGGLRYWLTERKNPSPGG